MATAQLRAHAFAVLIAVGLLMSACEGQPANSQDCLPGDFEAVTLPEGGKAYLRCNGEAYVPYDGPDPNVLPEASTVDAAACGADGAKLTYFCNGCTHDSDCVTGLRCISYVNKGGNFCVPACTTSDAPRLCVPPSVGCGSNGYCKP